MQLIRAIRAAHYDLVINLADQWRAALITRLSAAPARIGFAYKKSDKVLWGWWDQAVVTPSPQDVIAFFIGKTDANGCRREPRNQGCPPRGGQP